MFLFIYKVKYFRTFFILVFVFFSGKYWNKICPTKWVNVMCSSFICIVETIFHMILKLLHILMSIWRFFRKLFHLQNEMHLLHAEHWKFHCVIIILLLRNVVHLLYSYVFAHYCIEKSTPLPLNTVDSSWLVLIG